MAGEMYRRPAAREFRAAANPAAIVSLLDERDALAAKVARVEETAQILGRFDCLDDYVPPTVDVPDDYEAGVLDAVKSFRLALGDQS